MSLDTESMVEDTELDTLPDYPTGEFDWAVGRSSR